VSNDKPRTGPLEADAARAGIFASADWPTTGPFAPLWEPNVVFADGPPDHATATAYVSASVERHRLAAEAFADALFAGREGIDSATTELEASIVDLGLARAMVMKLSGDGPVDGDGWQIGFAGHTEYSDDVLPPLFELPVSIALGVTLLESGDTTVRARDLQVYSDGLLVSVDVAMTRPDEMPPEERLELEQLLSDVIDDDERDDRPHDRNDQPRLISASARASTHSCVAQWDYWIPTRGVGVDVLSLRNPLGHDEEPWRVTVDGELIDEARSRVIDLRPAS
jgi:hypothetical protein